MLYPNHPSIPYLRGVIQHLQQVVGTTRDKIIELGRAGIQRFGYHAFNYQQIAAELQIKNAAIHYYFPSKGDLGVAALEKDLADFRQLMEQMQDAAPAAKLDALLSVYDDYQPATHLICLAGVCGANYNLLPEPMQRATRQYTDQVIAWLTALFEAGRTAGAFHFAGRAEDLAAYWSAALIGLEQMARVQPAHFPATLAQLRGSLHEAG